MTWLVTKVVAAIYLMLVLPVTALVSYAASSEGVLNRGPQGSVVLYGADAFWYLFAPFMLVAAVCMVLVIVLAWVIDKVTKGGAV